MAQTVVQPRLGVIRDRLEAWRDNAEMMQRRVPAWEEARWQNEYASYCSLLCVLSAVEIKLETIEQQLDYGQYEQARKLLSEIA
jgi:hypothetical protein